MAAETKPLHVRQSVADAVKTWQRKQDAAEEAVSEPVTYPPTKSILHSIPQRERLITPDDKYRWMPYIEPAHYKTSFWQSIGRMFVWINLINTIFFGRFIDQLLRRDSNERQAVRLRLALE